MSDTYVDDNMQWDSIIGQKNTKFQLDFKEIWRYRDLMMLFVKKDIITVYKQTVLGPIWFIVQPIFTTLIYVVIFGQVAKIDTGHAPTILFYLGSITLWNYFSETLNVTSRTFTDNAAVFGKVFFPRLVLPLSKVISGLVKLFIQLALFFVCWIYYVFITKAVSPNWEMVYFPVFILIISLLSMGIGIIITSLTTKYRDLTFLVSFGVQLLMYATPIIYPISAASKDKQFILWLNPLTSIFEAFKYGFLGEGVLNYMWLGYTVLFTLVVVFIGLYTFGKVEKKFIDTI